ncbi:MAG TPA: RNA polymerase sigma factor [Blastocatellia bacterium]
MKTIQRMEITIETRRRLIVRKRRNPSRFTCSLCDGSPMFTPEEAAAIAGINTREIYRLIEDGLLHFNETPEGAILVCPNLLPQKENAPADLAWPAPGCEPPAPIEIERGHIEMVRLEGLSSTYEAGNQHGRPGAPRSRVKGWIMTTEAFEGLLACLDSDRERAGGRYENLRRKLVKYFECRGCLAPEDYTDETINRVARRVSEGKQIWTADPASYFYGVARNVLREYWTSPDRELAPLECLPPVAHPSAHTDDLFWSEAEKHMLDRQMDALDRCMNELPRESRELLIEYYKGEKGDRIRHRKLLARQLGIPPNALRIRVHRIREKLERCVNESVNANRPG